MKILKNVTKGSLKGNFEEPAKQAMGEAIINRAFINAGGTGGIINAKAILNRTEFTN